MRGRKRRRLRSAEPEFHHDVYVVLLSKAALKDRSILRHNPERDPSKPAIYVHPLDRREMEKYCYVYVLRSLHDKHFYVGLTRNLSARLQAHNKGLVNSTKKRRPLELVYWEGCRDESDAAQREKYLKTAWGKRYIKARIRRYLTG